MGHCNKMEVCGALSHLSFFCIPSLPSLLDYSEERLVAMTNSDLPNTMGNLLQRISTPRLNPGGPKLKFSQDLFPIGEHSKFSPECRATDEDFALINTLHNLPGKQLICCLHVYNLVCLLQVLLKFTTTHLNLIKGSQQLCNACIK